MSVSAVSSSTPASPTPSSSPFPSSSPAPGGTAPTVRVLGMQQPLRRPRQQTTAIGTASVGLGVVSLLVSAVPVVNMLALLGGIVAVGLGVVVLRRPVGGGPMARELAIAGVATGALAMLVSLLVLVVLGAVVPTAASIEEDLGIVTVEVAEG